MLNRTQIGKIIDTEREYQEKVWPSHDGHRYSEHCILLLEGYVAKARAEWLTSQDETAIVKQIAKIAAIAVRGLERIDGSEVLLTEPLR
jgi:hypothetical protein